MPAPTSRRCFARRLTAISPFTHVPRLPDGGVSAGPLLLLAGIAVVLAAGGLAGFSRRDLG